MAVLCAVLAALSSSACITGAALFDLVVPVPAARVSVKDLGRDKPLYWAADYGREPEDIGHFPTRL